MSSLGSSVLPSATSRPGLTSPTPSFRPFDQRFQSRISSPYLSSPRPSSPAFLANHSRNVSLSSQLPLDSGDTETPSPPWEVVRWTKLKRLNSQVFSEAGRRSFGSPTCLAVSASIVLGTSKGIILVFDYNQNIKLIIGPGTKGGTVVRRCLDPVSLTLSSRRVWPHHLDRNLCGSHHHCRRARKRKHIHMGHLAGFKAVSQHPASRSAPAGQNGRRPCAKRGRHSPGLSRHPTHRPGLCG